MTRCAEDILPAHEAHFLATIANLYAAKKGMPENLRHAREHNDETMERISIAHSSHNDNKRPEKLFYPHAKLFIQKMQNEQRN